MKKGNLDFVIMNEGDADNKGFEIVTIKEVENAFLYNADYFDFNKDYTLLEVSQMPLILQKKKRTVGSL